MYQPISGTGDGSAPVANLTFPYLDSAHVKAQVNGLEVPYTWTGASQVTLDDPVSNGDLWSVYRDTPIDPILVDFSDGSTLLAADLDRLADQLRFHQEEVDYRVASMPSIAALEAIAAGATVLTQDMLGQPDGVAELDSSGKVPAGQLDLSGAGLGLENVDNTSDMDKPVSTAQAAAIAAGRFLPVSNYSANFVVDGNETEQALRYVGSGGHTATVTNSMEEGSIVTIYNDGSGDFTIAGSGVTLANTVAGTTGSVIIPALASAVIHKVASGRVLIAPSRST